MAPSISKMLVSARKRQKMKQENLGPMVGCTRSYISKLENGETFPSLELAERLEKVLGIKKSQLVRAIETLRLKEKQIKERTRQNIRNLRAKFDGAGT